VGSRLFKLVASGNDFLVVDARGGGDDETDAAGARALCDRHEGVGADGLVTLLPSATATARFMLRNADGSRAAFSGNGARCAALLLHRLHASQAGCVRFETAAGITGARIMEEDELARVEVEIGAPRDIRLALELPAGSPAPRGDYAVVGVPYLAVAVEDVDALDLERVAPPLRRWSAFAEGANVAFYERPREGRAVRLRTWERGVEGETLSSGTGCAAVALALALHEGAVDGERRFAFVPRSGRPEVVACLAGGGITMLRLMGDARLVAEILLPPRSS
jgi:diaminopimelate epimerase